MTEYNNYLQRTLIRETTMDYEKKYKEALDWARKVMEGKIGFVLDDVLEKFPELKESEDEKIRKELTDFVKSRLAGFEQGDKYVAWLEKQGQVKESQISQHDNKICKENDNSLTSEDERIRKSLIILLQHFCKGYRVPGLNFPVSYKDMLDWVEKQGEQKPAWSEEDEKKRNLLIRILEVNCPDAYFKVNPVNTLNMEAMHTNELISWLKSLRPKNTWKPSDEQLAALHDAALYVDKSMFPYPKGILMKMYKQLKKLREE